MEVLEIYRSIKEKIESHASENTDMGVKYMGTPHKYYGLKMKNMSDPILDVWIEIKMLNYDEWIELLDLFYLSDVFEYKVVAGSILRRSKKQRQILQLDKLDEWLEQLYGWAEIDCTCQSTFESEELLSRWNEWVELLTRFNKAKNVSMRRASLVLLIKSVRKCRDERLMLLSFDNVRNIMHEKDILITKAISWILREMVKQYKIEVKEFVDNYQDSLPVIAVRETRRKIETGKKNG